MLAWGSTLQWRLYIISNALLFITLIVIVIIMDKTKGLSGLTTVSILTGYIPFPVGIFLCKILLAPRIYATQISTFDEDWDGSYSGHFLTWKFLEFNNWLSAKEKYYLRCCGILFLNLLGQRKLDSDKGTGTSTAS